MIKAQLLQWASEHKYPAIRFTGSPVKLYPVQGLPDVTQPMKYAIGIDGCKENKMFWETAIRMGNDDMISGVPAYIDAQEDIAG